VWHVRGTRCAVSTKYERLKSCMVDLVELRESWGQEDGDEQGRHGALGGQRPGSVR
jgi:hypothetical protein